MHHLSFHQGSAFAKICRADAQGHRLRNLTDAPIGRADSGGLYQRYRTVFFFLFKSPLQVQTEPSPEISLKTLWGDWGGKKMRIHGFCGYEGHWRANSALIHQQLQQPQLQGLGPSFMTLYSEAMGEIMWLIICEKIWTDLFIALYNGLYAHRTILYYYILL